MLQFFVFFNFPQNDKTKPSATRQNFGYLYFSKNYDDCWCASQGLGAIFNVR